MYDPYVMGRRLRQLHRLPWALPATLVVRLTDAHLDELDIAEQAGRGSYWLALNRIVHELTTGRESRA